MEEGRVTRMEKTPLIDASQVTPLPVVKPPRRLGEQMNATETMMLYREKQAVSYSAKSFFAVFCGVLVFVLIGYGVCIVLKDPAWIGILLTLLSTILVIDCVMLCGLFIVQPNEAKVMQLCGSYTGTIKDPGMKWTWPVYSIQTVSLRMRNFETERLKVNDIRGNPIEIQGVVVWAVNDTSQALFHVVDYQYFVKTQSESAFRNVAARYPYDSYSGEVSLLANTDEIAGELKIEIQSRLGLAGITVCEAMVTRLAFSAEIAGAMLQRQQATAIVAARKQIVTGAVGMVEEAIQMLEDRHVCTMDDKRKADAVANLLIVLCGERAAVPTLNLGQ